MLVNRKQLSNHLAKIYTNGQVKEAVLYDGFACNALNVDHQLLVMAPSLESVEPLPDPVGCVDVALLRKALGSLGGDTDQVSVAFEDDRILVDQKHGGRLRLITASPSLIQSAVKDETVEKVKGFFPEDPVQFNLGSAVIEGVLETAGMLDPDVMTLKVQEKSGVLVVGVATGHYAEFDVQAKTLDDEKPYELVFDAKLVSDVFKQLSDYTQTKITLSGEGSVISVNEGEYSWIISPQEPA